VASSSSCLLIIISIIIIILLPLSRGFFTAYISYVLYISPGTQTYVEEGYTERVITCTPDLYTTLHNCNFTVSHGYYSGCGCLIPRGTGPAATGVSA
jgi:hypothetical protein